MISYLKGKLTYKLKDRIIVEVNNIGYSVFISEGLSSDLKVDEDLQIFVFQNVKEDALDLYGFRNLAELEFFELLISVSGIGPKTALSILSVASLSDIQESIIRDDALLLTKVSGIGKKTAERVVLELKDKLIKLTGIHDLSSPNNFSADEIDVLLGLGYNIAEARDALKQVDKEIKDSSERVRQALKILAKK